MYFLLNNMNITTLPIKPYSIIKIIAFCKRRKEGLPEGVGRLKKKESREKGAGVCHLKEKEEKRVSSSMPSIEEGREESEF